MDMNKYETIQYIHSGQEMVIRPGGTAEFCFDTDETRNRLQLYFRGEPVLSYMWMTESGMSKQYMHIEDAFDTEHAWKSQYCLNFSQKKAMPYAKRVVKKCVWPPDLIYMGLHSYTDTWSVGISAKAEGLRVNENGYVRILIDRWDKSEGLAPEHAGRFPDSREVIDIPEGTYDWTVLEKLLTIPADTTACVLYTFEGMDYEGNLYVEAPFLISSNGYNILPEFGSSVQGQGRFDWLGENMSKKEWPEFYISLNDRIIYDGELFARCHRYPEFDVEIPADIIREKDNRLVIKLTTKCHDPLPFKLLDVAIVSTPGKRFSVVGNRELLFEGEVFPVLVRTGEENVEVTLESDWLQPIDSMTFPEKGLHVLRFEVLCGEYGKRNFRLCSGSELYDCTVIYLPGRKQDDVVTGSGDMIYVKNDDLLETENYLSWYIANQVGRLITVRPAYRWGGARFVEPKVWEKFCKIINAMGMKYAFIIEGRDLPGISANPSEQMLEGDGFLGRQLHERDGQLLYYYYPPTEYSPAIQEFFDLGQRKYRENPEYTEPLFDPALICIKNGKYSILRDCNLPMDMEVVGKRVIEEMKAIRRNFPRHSGPSAAFKYFYQAGFTFTSAELMYGSFETTSSFLRGASKAYGIKKFGAHHAVQWASSPHDVPEKYRRLRLALYLSYMHGISDINTEEGFWHIEEYYAWFDRFSEACRSHLKQQQDFNRYVNLHARTGQFYTPVAYVHGRYDGWIGFGVFNTVFGMPQMKYGEAEKGWELLKAVYPLNKPGVALTLHGCPVEPVGYYSGTPLGCADVIPAEKDSYAGYKLITFAGYHKAESEDAVGLTKYLQDGGRLITGWAYLSQTTDRHAVDTYRHSYIRFPGTVEMPEFIEDTFRGLTVYVASAIPQDAKVLETTDSGNVLVYEKQVEKGRMIFVNAREYAGNDALLELWTWLIQSELRSVADEEPSWMYCGNDVEFTVYDQEDGSRVFYVLAVDWYNDPEVIRSAILRVGEHKYPIHLKFGEMRKIVVNENVAVWADTEGVEITKLNCAGIDIIGVSDAHISIAMNGSVRTNEVMEPCSYISL